VSFPRVRPYAGLLLLAYLAFVSLGLPDGLLGVGWPAIRSDFAARTESVGFLLAASTGGYLISSVLAGFTVARLGVGRVLAGSTALAGLALAGFSLAGGLAPMAGCALLLGLGSGGIDSGLNAYAAGALGPRHMNWLHASFGLGVALGPAIMTAVIGGGLVWRWGYGVVAVAQLSLALVFGLTARAWGRETGGRAPGPSDSVPVRRTLALPAVWFGGLTFAAYVAVEAGAGLWAFLLLTEGRGLDRALAGMCVSGYWGSLFLGRVVQGVVAERLGPARVLLGGLVGMVAGAGLVALPAPAWVAVVGLAIIGFSAAPVFPLLTLTTAERVGPAHADRTIGLQIGAACLGGAVLPTAIGALISSRTVEVVGPALLVLSVLTVVLYLAATRTAATEPRLAGASPNDEARRSSELSRP
jgi:fucose permease